MGRLLACEAAPAALKDAVKPATALLFLRASFFADEVSLLVCTLQVFGVAAGLTLLLNYLKTSTLPTGMLTHSIRSAAATVAHLTQQGETIVMWFGIIINN